MTPTPNAVLYFFPYKQIASSLDVIKAEGCHVVYVAGAAVVAVTGPQGYLEILR